MGRFVIAFFYFRDIKVEVEVKVHLGTEKDKGKERLELRREYSRKHIDYLISYRAKIPPRREILLFFHVLVLILSFMLLIFILFIF